MAYNPYEALPQVPLFTVKSNSFTDGEKLPLPQISGMVGTGGGDSLPHLAWSDFPAETKSFALTCYDPDAPTASGFWHLAAYNIPVDVTELAEGAVSLEQTDGFPEQAAILRNDGGVRGFVGAAPPPGHGDHRYMFVVHALDVEQLDLDENASPAFLGFNMFGHTLGRAFITGVFGH